MAENTSDVPKSGWIKTKIQAGRIIKKGLIPRPHYALGILLACNQAVQIGLKKISVIEMGAYDKSSIIDLAEHKSIIESILPIKINIMYFNIKVDLFSSHGKIILPENSVPNIDSLFVLSWPILCTALLVIASFN